MNFHWFSTFYFIIRKIFLEKFLAMPETSWKKPLRNIYYVGPLRESIIPVLQD